MSITVIEQASHCDISLVQQLKFFTTLSSILQTSARNRMNFVSRKHILYMYILIFEAGFFYILRVAITADVQNNKGFFCNVFLLFI